MRQDFQAKRLILASHNQGKVDELGALVRPLGLACVGAAELGLAEPEETGKTFAANASLKARAAGSATGEPALSDDSGLCVDGLDGAPGIYSARWAQHNGKRDFGAAMRRVRDELQKRGVELMPEASAASPSARFVCVLALCLGGEEFIFEGEAKGRLVFPPRGEHGFGYDPIFVPENDTQSFGEMQPAEKHARSHRARAFAKFLCWLTEQEKA